MTTFNERETRLVQKLKEQPPQTTLHIMEACLLHSYCNPLPLFRVYRIDDATFEAQWNEIHRPGTSQTFNFAEIGL